MTESIRTFIAVTLDESVKEIIKALVDNFKTLNLDLKWVEIKNIHLTLKFLGDVSPEKIEKTTSILKECLSDIKPIATHLTSLGTFPPHRNPRVFWIGLDDSKRNLTQLAEKLEGKLGSIGFAPEERDFKAHVTLARIKSMKNMSLFQQKIETFRLPEQTFTLKDIVLFKSVLTPTGPIYEPIQTFHLPTTAEFDEQS